MKTLNRILTATTTAMVLGGAVLATASPASAATRNGVCETGEFCYYFNSGTWIRLLQFTPEMLASEESFAEVYKVLADGRMKAIDEAPGFVMDQTSAVSISNDDGHVIGSLVHVEGDGTGAPRVIKSFARS